MEEERRHGAWMHFKLDYEDAYCSECNEIYEVYDKTKEIVVNWKDGKKYFDLFRQLYKYCPHCGARMDMEVKE